jgi:hypothetical protein
MAIKNPYDEIPEDDAAVAVAENPYDAIPAVAANPYDTTPVAEAAPTEPMILPDSIRKVPTMAATVGGPKLNVNFDLRQQTRLQLSEGLEAGDSYSKWTTAAMLSYRMKRRLIPDRRDNDEENHHVLVLGGGYEYLHDSQNGKIKNENRIVLAGTGHFTPLGGGLLLTERNRIEFRWVEGTYNFRYRNKVAVDHHFKTGDFSFIPYAAGELFYDRNHHSWNENHYAFGSQFPYKKLLMVDAYSCTRTALPVIQSQST